jgi:hypothetical protein
MRTRLRVLGQRNYVTKDDFPLHDVFVTLSLETEHEPDQGNLNDDCPETSNTAREHDVKGDAVVLAVGWYCGVKTAHV